MVRSFVIFVTGAHIMAEQNQNIQTLQAIKVLRKRKLSQGIPFMINSDILPSHQCFLEYPDGIIKIAEADTKGCDFKIVFECSLAESQNWRKKLKLL